MKISQLPDPLDLLWLFESEPELNDPETPLPYNTLSYRTLRGVDDVTCLISPAYRDFELRWYRDGARLLELSLTAVTELRVSRHEGRQALEVHFDVAEMKPLTLTLKPRVEVCWGMDLSAGL